MATKKLEDYPRPGVAVDLAVMTVRGTPDTPELCVLVQEGPGDPAYVIPGRFVRERESVEQTVTSLLEEKVGLELPAGTRARLLGVFSDPDRDQRSWVMSVAQVVSLREDLVAGARGELVPVSPDATLPRRLGFDHDKIVEAAVEELRDRYEIRKKYRDVSPDPDGFLQPPWTLAQLRKVHEAVIGEPIHKDAFNRRMEGLVEPVRKKDGSPSMHVGIGRPAQLYRPRRRKA